MAQRLFVPRLGHTMVEGIVTKWYKEQDALVNAGEPVYDLEYDKATETIEAEKSGVLKRLVAEGDTVPVGEPVGVILEEGDDLEAVLAQKVRKAFVPHTPNIPMAAHSMASSGKQGAAAAPSKAPEPAITPEPAEKPDADVAIIGGGPGGYVAAIRAALNGFSAILIERDKLGGVCLNRGCIPTKALIESARLFDQCVNAKAFGVDAGVPTVNAAAVNARKQQVVNRLVKGVSTLLKARRVEVVSGEASFLSPTKLLIKSEAGERTVAAKSIIIATGAVPAAPPIPGIDGANVVTSDEALELTTIPESLAVIGGGVIGMELGSVYASFGAQVTVLEALDEILPTMDAEIAKAYHRVAAKRMDVRTGCRVAEISDADGKKRITFAKNGETCEILAEKVLVCTGRKPNLTGLNLAAAGVAVENGRVLVDENWRTNLPSVYCIGDANGKTMLAHAASAQGVDVADTLAGKATASGRHNVIPACVYTSPELAGVGRTEEALLAAGLPFQTARFPIRANGRALALGESEGLVKILYGPEYHEVLGVHIMAPFATELIAECALSLRLECTLEELAETIHAHPTVSEAVMEAAEAGLAGAIHSL